MLQELYTILRPEAFWMWVVNHPAKDERSPRGDFICDTRECLDQTGIPDIQEIERALAGACWEAKRELRRLEMEYLMRGTIRTWCDVAGGSDDSYADDRAFFLQGVMMALGKVLAVVERYQGPDEWTEAINGLATEKSNLIDMRTHQPPAAGPYPEGDVDQFRGEVWLYTLALNSISEMPGS